MTHSPTPSPSRAPQPQFYDIISAAFARAAPPVCANAPIAFVEYLPSAWETEWAAGINESAWAADPCGKLREPHHQKLMQRWLDISIPLNNPAWPSAPALEADPGHDVLSRMAYTDARSGERIEYAIEPLAGILRDPRSVCLDIPHGLTPDNSNVQSREFLVIDPRAARDTVAQLAAAPRKRRAILFDLGTSGWDSGSWPGLRLLYEHYAAAGIVFTDIYAWEAKPVDPATFYGSMPHDVAGAMHFFNVPVDDSVESASNPLLILRAIAQHDDFVVIKLDIDAFQGSGASLEERLALGILDSPALACLVDEMYFEHHVQNEAMRVMHWGNAPHSIYASLRMFQAFRRMGIRMHSWP